MVQFPIHNTSSWMFRVYSQSLAFKIKPNVYNSCPTPTLRIKTLVNEGFVFLTLFDLLPVNVGLVDNVFFSFTYLRLPLTVKLPRDPTSGRSTGRLNKLLFHYFYYSCATPMLCCWLNLLQLVIIRIQNPDSEICKDLMTCK